MSDFIAVNRALWDGWARLHADSRFYDVDAFRAGASTLNALELEQVGDVTGRSLLHLQCHFGLDTLSWARRGAHVTGVDFSQTAIDMARTLAAQTGLDARFVCADVCDLPASLDDAFDIVFTSYGVLSWLPDLERWAAGIARCLRPGGVLHLVEFHPLADMLGKDGRTIVRPYFGSAAGPELGREQGSYAEPDAAFEHDAYYWTHPLSEVVQAVLSSGLALRSMTEHQVSPYNCYPFTIEAEGGTWSMPSGGFALPLTYTLSAGKTA